MKAIRLYSSTHSGAILTLSGVPGATSYTPPPPDDKQSFGTTTYTDMYYKLVDEMRDLIRRYASAHVNEPTGQRPIAEVLRERHLGTIVDATSRRVNNILADKTNPWAWTHRGAETPYFGSGRET